MPRWCTFLSLLSLASVITSSADAQSGRGVVPASWHSSPAPGWPAMTPSAPGVATPLASGKGRTIFEELPDDTGWLYEDTPLERALRETFRHAYFRVEYLLWDISDPGNNTLAGPTNYPTFLYPPDLVRDPNNPAVLIPPSIYSTGAGPTQPASSNLTFDGAAARGLLPPVYHISNPAILAAPNFRPQMLIATQPTLADVQLNDNNGIRGTFGFVVPAGAFEASIFALQKSNAPFAPRPLFFADIGDIDDSDGDGLIGDLNTTEFLPTFDAVAQAFLVNGLIPSVPLTVSVGERQTATNPQLPTPSNPNDPTIPNPPLNQPIARGDNLRIIYAVRDPVTGEYVPTYQGLLSTEVWGAEGNFIAAYWDAGSPLQIQPLIGFRYVNFQESLRQGGAYTFTAIDPNTNQLTFTNVNRQINSATNNNLYGPQIGLRAELVNKWFSLGVQPKVMLGLNSYSADLQTLNVLRPNDRNQSLTLNDETFGVVGDLHVYSRVRLTEHLNVFVGYNFLWLGLLTRPADNIVYNARSINPAVDPVSENDLESDFQLNPSFSGSILQGLSVGGELRF
jgi:hypothetical protein